MTGWIAIIISLGALWISYLSYRRAQRADHRMGAALLEARIAHYPTLQEAWDGTTAIKVLNTGPSIAEDVEVTVTESTEAAEARERDRVHVTKITERLGVNQPTLAAAVGAVEKPEDAVVSWRDAAGVHSATPAPPPQGPQAFSV